MATARPPSVMVLIERPKYLNTSAAIRIDTGMAVSAMTVGRSVPRKKYRITATNTDAPTSFHLQVVDRRLDEAGLPEGHARRVHAGRQRRLHPSERVLDRPGERDGVGRRLLLDAEDDRRLAFEARVAALGRRRERHRRRSGAAGWAARLRDVSARFFEVIEPRGAAEVADQVLAAVELEEAARRVRRKALERGLELLVRDAQLRHARGVRLHLELPHLAADRDHLRDAGNRHQPRAQHPVGVLAHRHRRDLRGVDRDGDLHDLAHDRADRPHPRHHAFGQAFLHRRQAAPRPSAGRGRSRCPSRR